MLPELRGRIGNSDIAKQAQPIPDCCGDAGRIGHSALVILHLLCFDKFMSLMRVECYAGYRGDQRPLRFTLGAGHYEVREIEDQWYSPDATYFRVRADDGNIYVLRHEEILDQWTLEGFRAGR